MIDGVLIRRLDDQRRLQFRHGPIDLIVEVKGSKHIEAAALEKAAAVFPQILPDLVSELELLRSPVDTSPVNPNGLIARLMADAVQPHAHQFFVTPMIAVAGSVADHMLQVLTAEFSLQRAYVNNGGDIALFLGEGQSFDIAVFDRLDSCDFNSILRLDSGSGIGGVATSGWRGRSHSLGIADAVTVLASNAASADVAATLIANAVDLPGSDRVSRVAANQLLPDSDLGDLPVTIDVAPLSNAEVTQAISCGLSVATDMLGKKLIEGVLIALQGRTKVLGSVCQTLLVTA